MNKIIWIIHGPGPEFYKYDTIKLDPDNIDHFNVKTYPFKIFHKTSIKVLKLDCVFVNYFVKELHNSPFYRDRVFYNIQEWQGPNTLMLVPTEKDLIDYNWNDRMYKLAREKCEIDHAFSWFSTLGGAFSALGDYFENCAETAGKISIHQLKLAFKIGDPNMQARCRLYLSLSLIQKKYYKTAIKIIKYEYNRAKSQSVIDERLIKMCKGIWSKLQYEFKLNKNKKIQL